jgi:hypothetical protein
VTAVVEANAQLLRVRVQFGEAFEKLELLLIEYVVVNPGNMFEKGQYVVEVIG